MVTRQLVAPKVPLVDEGGNAIRTAQGTCDPVPEFYTHLEMNEFASPGILEVRIDKVLNDPALFAGLYESPGRLKI